MSNEGTQEQVAEQAAQDEASGFDSVFDTKAETPTDATPEPTSAKADADEAAQAKADAEAQEAKAAAQKAAAEKAAADSQRFLESLPGRIRNIEGHLGGLKSQFDTALATAKAAAEKRGGEAPTDKQVQVALANPKEWAALKEDFPEWAGPIEAEFAAVRNELAQARKGVDVEGIKKDVSGQVGALIPGVIEEAEERAFLRLKHPDWRKQVVTAEFRNWFQAQSPEIQQLGDSKRADDAIQVFDAYAAHQKSANEARAAAQRKQQRLSGGLTPQGAPSGPRHQPTDREAEQEGFDSVFK